MIFNNIDEGIEHILSRFESDDIELLRNCKASDIHFSLGIWIKNEFIYNEECNISKLIIEREKKSNPMFKANSFPTPHQHEEISHIVIEELLKKL